MKWKKFPKFDIPEIKIKKPKEKAYGDYASNVAMAIARQVKKEPMEITEISSKLKTTTQSWIREKIHKLFWKFNLRELSFARLTSWIKRISNFPLPILKNV